MHPAPLYKYYCRPEYGSKKLLIEFISGTDGDTFTMDVLDALKSIKPDLLALNDLWMNDEVMYTITSDCGEFTLSKDIWGFAFIMADNNQPCIEKINLLLLADTRFEKIEVDFNDYILPKH